MRMNRIEPAERRKELSAFQLQIEWQARRLHECFFNFDLGFIVVIQFENNIGEPFEVRVDRSVERELDVARVETTLLRIVIAYFDVVEIGPAGVATTDSSVVGNWPVPVPFAFTAGAPGAVAALATTELSVVGNDS